MQLDEFMRIAEAAAFLGTSPDSLRRWDRKGKLRAIRHPVNRYRLYRRDDLQRLLWQLNDKDDDAAGCLVLA